MVEKIAIAVIASAISLLVGFMCGSLMYRTDFQKNEQLIIDAQTAQQQAEAAQLKTLADLESLTTEHVQLQTTLADRQETIFGLKNQIIILENSIETLINPPVEATETVEDVKIIKTFYGNGLKNTEQFSVKSPWLLRFKMIPSDREMGGYLGITVQKGDLAITGTNTDIADYWEESWVYRPGTFYLDIMGISCSWEIQIIQK